MGGIKYDELEMYEMGGRRVVAADNAAGRALASEVLGGPHADAEGAEPLGMWCQPETDEQESHLARHGWYVPKQD